MRALVLISALLLVSPGCPEPAPSTTPDGTSTPDATDDSSVTPDGSTDKGGPGPDIPTGPNAAPELERIGDRIVGVDEQLVIVLEASDPDGDDLTFSVFGSLPDGAKFDKAERRFEWTPEAAGSVVFLTFVVSDGAEFDRETIRVEVVAESTSNPPEFQPVGDQTVVADQLFSLQLEATDPDGQAITYGFEGSAPGKPQIDEETGLFEWTPSTKLIGETVRMTFTASDGGLTTSLEVDFIVTDGSSTGGDDPLPPTFEALDAQTATVGQPLSFTLVAQDPNPADTLEYAIFAGAPEGASLDGATFSWTPGADAGGTAWEVVFSVTDGTFTSFTTVEITVEKAPVTTTCADDPGEPNGSIATATALEPGTIARTMCDSELAGVDADFYVVSVAGGDKVDATLTFDPTEGDLELFFVNAQEQILASSQTLAGEEALSWTAPADAEPTYYIVVLGVGQSTFAMDYSLTLAVEANAVGCVEDDQEPNDTVEEAKPLPGTGATLQICAGNKDFFLVPLTCGQNVTVTLDTGGTGDLDFGLYPPGSNSPVTTGATEAPVEIGTAENLEESGDYVLRVEGWPAATEEGSYTLSVDATGACPSDTAGTDQASAMTISGETGTASDFSLCCADDWFKVALSEGENLVLDLSITSGSAGMVLRNVAGDQLAASAPSPDGDILQYTAEAASDVFIVVQGPTNTAYTLDWLVEAPTTGACTTLSCPKFNVCNPDTGECVSDFCTVDADCPTGHVCLETYCATPCTADADCRTEYGCKAFAEGRHCGITGSSTPGESCFAHTSCDGNAICWFKDNDGYCAAVGCLEDEDVVCPSGTECTLDASDTSLCGASCTADTDCRVEDGFTCTPPENTCLPL